MDSKFLRDLDYFLEKYKPSNEIIDEWIQEIENEECILEYKRYKSSYFKRFEENDFLTKVGKSSYKYRIVKGDGSLCNGIYKLILFSDNVYNGLIATIDQRYNIPDNKSVRFQINNPSKYNSHVIKVYDEQNNLIHETPYFVINNY